MAHEADEEGAEIVSKEKSNEGQEDDERSGDEAHGPASTVVEAWQEVVASFLESKGRRTMQERSELQRVP